MPRLSTNLRADNLHGIIVFLRVVDAGSLSRAARSLGVSPSAVSATLARLEERLDTRLLNRTTRRLEVTEEGREFYERCRKIVADLETAELSVGRAGREPSGFLRVGLPSTLGAKWIVPELGRFIETYPAVSLEVVCTDFVPFTIREGLDVAVQIGELHDFEPGGTASRRFRIRGLRVARPSAPARHARAPGRTRRPSLSQLPAAAQRQALGLALPHRRRAAHHGGARNHDAQQQ